MFNLIKFKILRIILKIIMKKFIYILNSLSKIILKKRNKKILVIKKIWTNFNNKIIYYVVTVKKKFLNIMKNIKKHYAIIYFVKIVFKVY